MRIIQFILIFCTFSIASCIEKYPVDFADQSPKLVVECDLLDIDSVHYVKLSLSKASFSNDEFDITMLGLINKFQPVTDAQITISDNLGVVDTLIGEPDSVYYIRLIYNEILNIWVNDTIFERNEKSLSNGYYCSKKLKVAQGNTYHLTVIWRNKVYESLSYMPYVPNIDKVVFNFNKGETGKENYYIPYIWFTDNPNTKDFYLFKTNFGDRVWSRAILSDEHIKTEINGIDVFKGESFENWRNSYPTEAYAGMTYRIEMHSITKEIYEYYRALIAQIRNDGGVYTPSPFSPPTNISNGALGYFKVSGVRIEETIIPHSP